MLPFFTLAIFSYFSGQVLHLCGDLDLDSNPPTCASQGAGIIGGYYYTQLWGFTNFLLLGLS
jgi:hypothetical protein